MLLKILKGIASIPVQAAAAVTESISSRDPYQFARQLFADLGRMITPGGGGGGSAREEGQEANKASSYIDANGRYVRR